ncbi:16S rRNA (cytosine(1402)-N(4))-methyltransferase RsmH [bacterium]|nr:16S rRNA (cytosine(1402)-N(4))-methyltransferase RsmH [bacterium]
MQLTHLPVMAAEVVEFLVTRTSGLYIDCTVGAGGHARQILLNAPSGRLLGLDLDRSAIEIAGEVLHPFSERVKLVRTNFAGLRAVAETEGFVPADGVLFDLGFSSMQLDDAGRGFSYANEGPVDMRLDGESGRSAAQLIAHAHERGLAEIIRDYGEERRARPIARAIVSARDSGKLETTADLAAAVISTRPKNRTKTLARVFQAFRIAVNDELGNLREGLKQAGAVLRPGGRIVVISYHSLEDRITKRFFVNAVHPCTCPRDLPECACGKKPTLRIITKRIVTPGPDEVVRNPRARSAKLRVAERLPDLTAA